MMRRQRYAFSGFERLNTKIDTVAHQVDLLQMHHTDQKKPWYKQPSVIIAAFALILSIITAIDSVYRSDRVESYGRKQELRAALQRITEIQRQTIINLNDVKDCRQRSELMFSSGQESFMLARHAQSLIEMTKRPLITPEEYYGVGLALFRGGDISGATELISIAAKSASAITRSESLMLLANIKFRMKDAPEGRRIYAEMANNNENIAIIDIDGILREIKIQIEWASGEKAAESAPDIYMKHILIAQELADKLPDILKNDQIKNIKHFSEVILPYVGRSLYQPQPGTPQSGPSCSQG